MRIKLIVSYDGSKFNGFQRQKDGNGVQNALENALTKIYNHKVIVKGSGRTDAGVHANNQVIHYNADNIEKDLVKKLNNDLNPNIVVKKALKVKDDFHSRYSVKKKEYVYKINIGPYKSSLYNYYYQTKNIIDIPFMKEAARLFVGSHDFKNFISSKKENTNATIYSLDINRVFNKLEIRIIGTNFYKYMVRNIVGALLEVGMCKVSFLEVREMINNPNKKRNLMTAPPQGLYLNKIWY
ncbi:MAG: tRNA pseudouridine(38-40) synthase TruA [Mollicutes bacterium]|nr:tRNA pseudouridine(38-40) synthase TruA [Mollicutes bacterium]